MSDKTLSINVNDGIGTKDIMNPAQELQFVIKVKPIDGRVKRVDIENAAARICETMEKQGIILE